MDKKEHIEYWLKTAEDDLKSADNLFLSGGYNWCLFLGHLVLEKTLKALYYNEFEETPPRTHDLVKIHSKLKLELTDENIMFLMLVNSFQIEARYPDEKLDFYIMCTKEFTEINFNKIKELYKWLLSQLKY